MANKLRSVNTKFWDDTFTAELKPTEKLLFLYLITNPLTKLIGIYEISIRRICFDTGLNEKMVEDGIKRFETVRKAFFIENFIILPNWLKHQNLNSNMKKAVIKEFNDLPISLKNIILASNDETVSNDYETILNHLQMIRKEEVEVEEEVEDESKSKIRPKDFYKKQIELSGNNDSYTKFVEFLYGKNSLDLELTGILSIKEQLTFEQFEKLLARCKSSNIKLGDIITGIENKPKYYKDSKTVYRTVLTWINNSEKR